MDELVSDYEKLSKIIELNSNRLQHLSSLSKLVRNFYKKHFEDTEFDKEKEVSILSFILNKKIQEIYERESAK